MILRVLEPFADEDDEIKSFVIWFHSHAVLLPPAPLRIAFLGETGSGKSTTLNRVLQEEGLSNAVRHSEV